MAQLNVSDARCEALFASGLQRSDLLTAEAVAEVISGTVRQLGIRGCASRMAQEFGDHPEAARDRMRWVLQLAAQVFARPAARSAARAGEAATGVPRAA
jgi:hypothetical protein